MSAAFILEYGGVPVRFAKDAVDRPLHTLVTLGKATLFPDEAAAWFAAYQNNLNPANCRVVSSGERQ